MIRSNPPNKRGIGRVKSGPLENGEFHRSSKRDGRMSLSITSSTARDSQGRNILVPDNFLAAHDYDEDDDNSDESDHGAATGVDHNRGSHYDPLFEEDDNEEASDDGDGAVEEEALPADIESSKAVLRRMSIQMQAMADKIISPKTGDKPIVLESILSGFKNSLDVATTGGESEDSVEYEEVFDESEVLEEEEIVEVEEEEVVEEVVLEEVLEEIVEEEVLEDIPEANESHASNDENDDGHPDPTELDHTEVEEMPDNEDDENDDNEDEAELATEEEIREAIVYILKQEKPIDNGYLTPSQATRMMALPIADMREIMKHFELCDNAGEPICWNLIVEIVTPDGDTPDGENPEDDDGVDLGDSKSESDSSGSSTSSARTDGLRNDDSLSSGFELGSLKGNNPDNSSISMDDPDQIREITTTNL